MIKAYHYFGGVYLFTKEPKSREDAFLVIGPDTKLTISKEQGWFIGIPEWLWGIVWNCTQWIPVW